MNLFPLHRGQEVLGSSCNVGLSFFNDPICCFAELLVPAGIPFFPKRSPDHAPGQPAVLSCVQFGAHRFEKPSLELKDTFSKR